MDHVTLSNFIYLYIKYQEENGHSPLKENNSKQAFFEKNVIAGRG